MGLDPDAVTRKTFENSFRGYDPMEVQAYLLVMADELRAGRDREFELELRLSEADRRGREAQAEAARLSNQLPPPGPPSLDDLDHGELARLVGDETARVLEVARSGAADIVARAEAEAEATVAEAAARARARIEVADEEAIRRRDEVESEVGALRREAEADSSELRTAMLAEVDAARTELEVQLAAEREAFDLEVRAKRASFDDEMTTRRADLDAELEQLQSTASDEATAIRAAAEAEQVAVMEASRALVREAREFRKQVLSDLSARRHAAREQLEQLMAARDHLAQVLGTARGTLDELHDSTETALGDARERAEAARLAAASDDPVALDELEAFLVARRGDPVSADATVIEVEQDPSEQDLSEQDLSEQDLSEHDDAETAVAQTPAPVDGEPEVVTSLFARIRADADAFIEPTPPVPVASAPDGPADDEAPLVEVAQLTAADFPPAAPALEGAATDAELFDRRSRALAGPERGLGRVLKKVLSEEQNELLDAVRRLKDLPTLDEVLGSEDDHALRFAAAARGELRDAAYAGVHLLDAAAEGVERPDVDDLATHLGLDLVAPLRERLEACWSDAGGDEMEVLELARGTYRQWRNKVLPALTHQYVALAFNRGLTAASGADAQRWLVDAGS